MQNLIGDSFKNQNTHVVTKGTSVTSVKASNCQTSRLLIHLHNILLYFPYMSLLSNVFYIHAIFYAR